MKNNRIAAATLTLYFLFSVFRAVAFAGPDDNFIRGYVTAVLEREFSLSSVSPAVEDGVVVLKAEDVADTDRDGLIKTLSAVPGVRKVEITDSATYTAGMLRFSDRHSPDEQKGEYRHRSRPDRRLFAPLIADPRWPHFSVSYHRYIDDGDFKNIAAVSFGETLPLYTWSTAEGGYWEVGLQAAVFAYFDLSTPSWDLLNEDYIAALPFAYRKGDFSALFRIFHDSVHLGDEFLLRSKVEVNNYSYESLDAKLSYDLDDKFRIYGGGEYAFSRDPNELKPWAIQYGIEYRSPRKYYGGLIRPVAGADLKNRQENDWHNEISLNVGFSIENESETSHMFQVMLGYYNGNSPSGQFRDQLIEFISLGGHFYF